MDLNHLINLCIECTRTFSPIKVTLETHIEEFFATKQITDETTQTFIQEIVYTHKRYENLTQKLISQFIDLNSSLISRMDRVRYEVLLTILMWKMGDLGYEQFEELLLSQPSHKILPFLTHFTDQNIQLNSFRDTCAEFLDVGYVDSHVLSELRFFLPQLERLIEKMERENTYAARKHLDNLQQLQEQKQQRTQFMPFHLSSPRTTTVRKNVYEADDAPLPLFHARPVPEELLRGSLASLEAERAAKREEAREMVKAKYEGEEGFTLRTEIVSVHEEQRKEREIAAKEKQEEELRRKAMEEERKRLKMVAQAKSNPEVVKLTSAAILREGALYQRLQARKVDEVMRYIGDMMDSHEYERWRQQMLALDAEERRKKVEERREQLIASAESKLTQARERLERLQSDAQQQKLELKRQEANRAREREEDRERKREMKVKVEEDKANVEARVGEMREQKSQQADALRRQMARDREIMAQERELELAMRKELIAQIQEMTRLAALKAQEVKVVDINSTSGIGSLSEMSLLQLRVRLEEVKTEMEEEEQRRRQSIVEQKVKREDMITSILRQNERARNQRKEYGDYVREQRVEWKDLEGKQARERELSARVEDFESKKKEERRLLALELARRNKDHADYMLLREKREHDTSERRKRDAELALQKRDIRDSEQAARQLEQAEDIRDQLRANRLAVLRREQRARGMGVENFHAEMRVRNEEARERAEMDMQKKTMLVQQIRESKTGVAPTEPMTLSLGVRNFEKLPESSKSPDNIVSEESQEEVEYDIDVRTGKTYVVDKKNRKTFSGKSSVLGKSVLNGNSGIPATRAAGKAIVDSARTNNSMLVTRAAVGAGTSASTSTGTGTGMGTGTGVSMSTGKSMSRMVSVSAGGVAVAQLG